MKVFVSDLQFLAFHGVSGEERVAGHRFRLDLVAQVDETASATDRVEETVDYGELAATAVRFCSTDPHNTVEYVCEAMGKLLLDEFPRIQELTVTLAKLHPSLPLSIGAVGVEKRFLRRRE